jgi:hypothetical protein
MSANRIAVSADKLIAGKSSKNCNGSVFPIPNHPSLRKLSNRISHSANKMRSSGSESPSVDRHPSPRPMTQRA